MAPGPALSPAPATDGADLSKIAAPTIVSPIPQTETSLERADLDRQRMQAELDSLQQDTAERKKYAGLFFALSCSWIFIITAMLLLQGFGMFWQPKFPFKLSEPVMLAVIGSTTVNILGILYVVANYLFPKK